MASLDDMDLVHNPKHIDLNGQYSARIFRIEAFDSAPKTMALVDSICSSYEPYAVLEEDLLTIILFDSIVQLDLSTDQIIQFKAWDAMGGLYEIHAIPNGYIIWGEGNVFRCDRSLNQVWHFSGRDILVSQEAKRNFWIDGQWIHCRDFLGYHYILDWDGKLLREFLEFENSETP